MKTQKFKNGLLKSEGSAQEMKNMKRGGVKGQS
jgi:hypothetical protein